MQFFTWRGGGVGIWTNQSSKVQTLEGGGGGKLKLQIDKAYHARLISQEKRFMQRNRKWSLGKFLFLVRWVTKIEREEILSVFEWYWYTRRIRREQLRNGHFLLEGHSLQSPFPVFVKEMTGLVSAQPCMFSKRCSAAKTTSNKTGSLNFPFAFEYVLIHFRCTWNLRVPIKF